MRPIDSLRSGDSIGARFFQMSTLPMIISASLVSYALSIIWFLRTGAETLQGLGLTGLYLLVTVLGIQLYRPGFRLYEEDERRIIEYSRPGYSWGVLLEGLVGCAIVFALAYFVVLNSFSSSPDLASMVAYVAIGFDFLLVPLIPVTAGSPRIPFLKTSVRVLVSDNDQVAEVLSIEVSMLDLSWFQVRNSDELRQSLLSRFQEMITDCALPH